MTKIDMIFIFKYSFLIIHLGFPPPRVSSASPDWVVAAPWAGFIWWEVDPHLILILILI
jgi:hypothetical protein